jgi:Mg2+ and Co2+ transporter CorA
VTDAVIENTAHEVSEFTNVIDNFVDDLESISETIETIEQVLEQEQAEEQEAIHNPPSETQEIVEEVIDLMANQALDPAYYGGCGDQPALDGTFGKTDYKAGYGDTLKSIAAAHGQTVEDLLLINPSLTADTQIRRGMVISIFDETRLNLAKAIKAAESPEELKELIQDYVDYASVASSTPEDLLPAIREDLLALRASDDVGFAAAVDEVFLVATETWQSQGRTHEVMDRLQQLADAGDIDGLKQALFDFFKGVATANPKAEDIEAQKKIFEAYGPEGDVFAAALEQAYFDFNTGQVYEAAAAIADAYATSGPIAAADLLAHYTSPEVNDLLTAARIFNAAKPTINLIVSHISFGDVHPWPGNAAGEPFFHIDFDGKDQILGSITVAMLNVSGSTEAAAAIINIAKRINAAISTYNLPNTLAAVNTGILSSILDMVYSQDQFYLKLERQVLDNDPYQRANMVSVNDVNFYNDRKE